MSDLVIPMNLEASDWIPRQWFADLPTVVSDLAERWSLRLDEPYQPGGMTAWVAPATDDAGRELVLKVGSRPTEHEESEHEADGLRLWDGDGAVRIHASLVTRRSSALLVERCTPGTQLKASVDEPAQDVIVAGLLQRLWRHSADGQPFRPLQDMCDVWADEFETKLAAEPGAVDAGLAREGMELFRALPSTATRQVLLCTDLHGDNILAAQREPWLVIDPKPYVGDPHYDPLQHMLNCPDRLHRDPHGFAQRMTDLTDLDADRLRMWLFARCVQESIGTSSVEPFAIIDLRDVAAALGP